jgi:hypothetical protein
MRKRNAVRGVLAGIISHYIVLFGLLFLFWLLRPFVWAAIYGVPFQPMKGPMDPNSDEWLILQGIGFLSCVAGGYAACCWDKVDSNRSLLIIAGVFLALILFGNAPENTSLVRMALFYFEVPVGMSLGWLFFRRSELRSTVSTEVETCES